MGNTPQQHRSAVGTFSALLWGRSWSSNSSSSSSSCRSRKTLSMLRECEVSEDARGELLKEITNFWIRFLVTITRIFSNITTTAIITFSVLSALENVTVIETYGMSLGSCGKMKDLMFTTMRQRVEQGEDTRGISSGLTIIPPMDNFVTLRKSQPVSDFNSGCNNVGCVWIMLLLLTSGDVETNPGPTTTSTNKDFYKIGPSSSKEVGLALIVNFKEFEGRPDKKRDGSEKDVENLKNMFHHLNFKVDVLNDLTRPEFVKALLSFSEKLENNDLDICAICVMSHGDRETVETSDNLTVRIEADILERFSNEYCRSMIGKPKLFIFQNCRGGQEDHGILEKCRSMTADTDSVRKVASVLDDSVIAYSTIPNYVAYRNKKDGSYFIQSLCEVFKEHADVLKIEDLFKKVAGKMKAIEVNGNKATPEFTYRMDKHLYFQPRRDSRVACQRDNTASTMSSDTFHTCQEYATSSEHSENDAHHNSANKSENCCCILQ